MTETHRVIPLDCGHETRLPFPCPQVAELLYCRRCQTYTRAAPARARREKYTHEEKWTTTPLGKHRFSGACLICSHHLTGMNWYTLRDKMNTHHRITHEIEVYEFREHVAIPKRKRLI